MDRIVDGGWRGGRARTGVGGAAHLAAGGARIGPNALIQTHRALCALHGETVAARVRDAAWPEVAVDALVEERHFVAAVQAVEGLLGEVEAARVLALSGRLVAEYVARNRIPAPVRALLPLLPARAGVPLLLAAFERNAWTFVGSGSYGWRLRPAPQIRLGGCITCPPRGSGRPRGAFYAAAFGGLISILLRRPVQVTEVECASAGGACCRFAIHPVEGPDRVPDSFFLPTREAPCASS